VGLRAGLDAATKIKDFNPSRKSNPSRTARILVTILTELYLHALTLVQVHRVCSLYDDVFSYIHS